MSGQLFVPTAWVDDPDLAPRINKLRAGLLRTGDAYYLGHHTPDQTRLECFYQPDTRMCIVVWLEPDDETKWRLCKRDQLATQALTDPALQALQHLMRQMWRAYP